MADRKLLEILHKGVEAWNAWREANTGLPMDLTGSQFRGADLREADFSGVDLTRADFSSADLIKAHLGGANLSQATLYRADLSRANLYGANLRRADLRAAYLNGAHISRSTLIQASLKGASLIEANLIEVNLSDADVTDAHLNDANLMRGVLADTRLHRALCGRTIFVDVDLSTARGLSSTTHGSPSSVGMDTLQRSNGAIPASFLRGCGLADWEIEFAKLYRHDLSSSQRTDILYRVENLRGESPIQISPLFISYTWANSDFVDRLAGVLDARHIRYWRDKKDAEAGRLDKVIDRGIQLNPTVLLVLSEASVNSPWVEYEVGTAVDIARELERDVLCPIQLDDAWLTSSQMSGELRRQLKKYNVISFEGWEDESTFHNSFRKLLKGLKLHYPSGSDQKFGSV